MADLHQRRQLQPVFSSWAHNARCDFDSYLIHSGLTHSDSVGSYLQVFRNGAFESLNTLAPLDRTIHQKEIQSLELEERLLTVLPRYFAALRSLGAQPPVVLGLSLIGVAGYSMAIPPTTGPYFVGRRLRRIDTETLFLPEVVAETFECDLGEVLKPAFDALWKAAGWEGSIFYSNSEWVGLAKVFPTRS